MQIQAFPIEHKIESRTLSYDTSIMISYKESGLTCLMLPNAGGGTKKSEQVKTPRGGVQYVAQYPDGTSIRTVETKTKFLRRPFQFSVKEVFRMKAEHFSFKMNVLAI